MNTINRLWNLSSWLRKDTEARHVSGVILCARPEMPLHDALKVKPGLPWSPNGVEDVTGCLLRKASNQAWRKPKREKSVTVNNVEKHWSFEELFCHI